MGVDRCSLSWGSGRGLLEVYWGWTDAASAGDQEALPLRKPLNKPYRPVLALPPPLILHQFNQNVFQNCNIHVYQAPVTYMQ